MVDADRRELLAKLSMWTSLLASYGTAVAFAARFLSPRRRATPMWSVFVARLTDLQDGGSRDVIDLRGLPAKVLRDGNDVRALSLVCTHLGCRVRWEPETRRFFCPCHDGVFDREGRVVSGPPPRPLDRYGVQIVSGSVFLEMKEPIA